MGRKWKDIINAAFNDHNKITFSEFMCMCSGCDGDWAAIILSGMERIYPEVYSTLPPIFGQEALDGLTKILILCGVEF